MNLRFDERKTTELAALFLQRAGGRMPYLKLMKLLYMADRLAFERHGSPITGDSYVSMNLGPVLSNTLDLIKNPPNPEHTRVGEFWGAHIARSGYDVVLAHSPEPVLCDADIAIAEEIFAHYGGHGKWDLAELTHAFPEWRNPRGGALPIGYDDILTALGKGREETEAVLSRLRARALMEDYAAES